MPTTTVAAFMFRHSVEDESSYSQTWGIRAMLSSRTFTGGPWLSRWRPADG